MKQFAKNLAVFSGYMAIAVSVGTTGLLAANFAVLAGNYIGNTPEAAAAVLSMDGANASSRPLMDMRHDMASSTMQVNASTTPMGMNDRVASSCPPVIAATLARGSHGGDVSKLQNFLLSQGLLASSSVSGFFGSTTEQAVGRWQMQQGLASSSAPSSETGVGTIGPRTRAFIAKCTMPPHMQSGMGTSTAPMPPMMRDHATSSMRMPPLVASTTVH